MVHLQVAVLSLRVRAAEQGELDAAAKLAKAQQRVAELCTELGAAKTKVQRLARSKLLVRMACACMHKRTHTNTHYCSQRAHTLQSELTQTLCNPCTVNVFHGTLQHRRGDCLLGLQSSVYRARTGTGEQNAGQAKREAIRQTDHATGRGTGTCKDKCRKAQPRRGNVSLGGRKRPAMAHSHGPKREGSISSHSIVVSQVRERGNK